MSSTSGAAILKQSLYPWISLPLSIATLIILCSLAPLISNVAADAGLIEIPKPFLPGGKFDAEQHDDFWRALPTFLLWFVSLGLISVLLSTSIISLVTIFMRGMSALLHGTLETWLAKQKLKSENNEEKHTTKALNWHEIVSFLEAEKFAAVVARAQRLGMTDYLKLLPYESTRVAIRRIRDIIELLYAAKGAIELAGPGFDGGREHHTVFADEQDAVRRFITTLELYAAAFQLLETLKRAVITIVPFAVFFILSYSLSGRLHAAAPPVFLDWTQGILTVDVVKKAELAFAPWGFDSLAWQCLGLLFYLFVALLVVRVLGLAFDAAAHWIQAAFRGRGVIATGASIIIVALGASFILKDGSFDIFAYDQRIGSKNYFFASIDLMSRLAIPYSETSDFLPNISGGQLFTIRIFSAAIVTSLFLALVNLVADEFEYGVQNRIAGGVTVPPELIKLGGAFLAFVIVTALTYASILEFARAGSGGGGGGSVGSASFGEAVPYSVFLAIVGALLTLATRDLLENYFSGIAIRVDPPFQQGDRITIDDGPMCAVETIGIRAVRLYEIGTNSEIVVSHRQLSSCVLKNYSAPTLDYRRHIDFVFSETKSEALLREYRESSEEGRAKGFAYTSSVNSAAQSMLTMSVPRRAESLLLVMAMLTRGVIRPRIPNIKLTCPDGISRDLNSLFLNGRLPIFAGKKGSTDPIEVELRHLSSVSRVNDRLIVQSQIGSNTPLEGAQTDNVFNPGHWDDFEKLDTLLDHKIFKSLRVYEITELLTNIEKSLPNTLREDGTPNSTLKEKDALQISVFKELCKGVRARILEIIALTARFDHLAIVECGLNGSFPQLEAIRGKPLLNSFLRDGGHIATRISSAYAEISNLLWEVREIDLSIITKSTTRNLDKASLALLDPPRVHSQRKITEQGETYQNVRLDVTLTTAEQSDELIHHMNTLAAMYQDRAALA